LELDLRLTRAEMTDLIRRRQRQILRRQLVDVDEEMMVPGVLKYHARGSDAHAAKTEANRDGRRHFSAVFRAHYVNLRAFRRRRSRQLRGRLLRKHGGREQ